MRQRTWIRPFQKKRFTRFVRTEAILALVDRALSESGYEVLLARDGATALTTVRERNPALALLDISMPELDGCEVTSTLKSDAATKDTIVILFTARSEASDVEKGYQAGADDYIMKPFTLKPCRAASPPHSAVLPKRRRASRRLRRSAHRPLGADPMRRSG